MVDLIIATSNFHKVREFRAFLAPLKRFVLYSLTDFPGYEPPEETGVTFEENALLKARHAAKHLKKLALADDSGLVVPALNGAPGVFSARYAGPNKTDLDNRKKLLQEMAGLEGQMRSAYFECVLALCDPSGFEKCVTGKVEGHIALKEKGSKGFGYDSLFIKHDYALTFGELDPEVKNRISHRFRAFEKLRSLLEKLPA
jgi:XTP/dITP diphosphohydrolase